MRDRILVLGRRRQRDKTGAIDRDLNLAFVHLAGNGLLIQISKNYRVLTKGVRR